LLPPFFSLLVSEHFPASRLARIVEDESTQVWPPSLAAKPFYFCSPRIPTPGARSFNPGSLHIFLWDAGRLGNNHPPLVSSFCFLPLSFMDRATVFSRRRHRKNYELSGLPPFFPMRVLNSLFFRLPGSSLHSCTKTTRSPMTFQNPFLDPPGREGGLVVYPAEHQLRSLSLSTDDSLFSLPNHFLIAMMVFP